MEEYIANKKELDEKYLDPKGANWRPLGDFLDDFDLGLEESDSVCTHISGGASSDEEWPKGHSALDVLSPHQKKRYDRFLELSNSGYFIFKQIVCVNN